MSTKSRRARTRKQRRKSRQAKASRHDAAGRHMLKTGRTGAVEEKRRKVLEDRAKRMAKRIDPWFMRVFGEKR